MASDKTNSKLFQLLLGVLLVLTTVLFGIQVSYSWQSRLTLGLILFVITGVVAWRAGARCICSTDSGKRQLALTGILLIAPWTLFAFLIGVGTPEVASPAENQLRYLVLTISASLVVGGLIVLRQWVSDANERMYSTIGLWCTVLAAMFYLGFTAISLVESRAIGRSPDLRASLEFRVLDELSLTFLYLGAIFTYGATAALTTSMSHTGVLTRKGGRVFGVLSTLSILLVALHITKLFSSASNHLWSFENWYSIPGQILAIPAVPWIMLGVLGVLVLRRATILTD